MAQIESTDLVVYGSASRPEDDTSTSGGAIDTANRPSLTQLTANAKIAVVSDGADTRTLTVTGKLATGAVDTEVLTLNGTTEVLGAKTFEMTFKHVLSASDASRTVTIKQGSGGSTIATIGPNETSRSILFQRSASENSQVVRYEKVFKKNKHATLPLTNARVVLTADPLSNIKMGLASSVNDSGSVTNRKTAPSGVTFVDDNVEVNVPGGSLGAGDAIGVWVSETLDANETRVKSTFTIELRGYTTD